MKGGSVSTYAKPQQAQDKYVPNVTKPSKVSIHTNRTRTLTLFSIQLHHLGTKGLTTIG